MEQKKVLIFTKNWLGDVVFEEPFIRAVHRVYGNPYLVCVTNYRCKEILEANPYVHEVICFDDRKKDKRFWSRARLIWQLRKKKIDTAFLLHRSWSRAAIVWAAGIRERYGYPTKGRGPLLTCRIAEPREEGHRIDYFLSILKQLNLFVDAPDASHYFFYCADSDKKRAAALMSEHGLEEKKFVVLNPGGNWIPKRWPIANWVELLTLLNETYRMPVVISGALADQCLADEIRAGVDGAKPISVCGKTSIGESAALCASAALVISADSGPLHIAGGVGVPVIALFGPTDARQTGPRGSAFHATISNAPEWCSIPCFKKDCDTALCMAALSPAEVMTVIAENNLLKSGRM